MTDLFENVNAEVVEETQMEIEPVVMAANELQVTDDETNRIAAELLKDIKTRQKQVKDLWLEPKQEAKKAHSTICQKEKDMLEPLSRAEGIIKASMSQYHIKLERERQEIQAAKEAELRRIEQEAQEALEAGDVEAMTEIAIKQSEVANISEAKAERVSGVSVKKVWKFEITDANQVPREYMIVNEKAIGQVVKATNGAVKIPGVRAYQENQIAAKGW
jgi:hypothetical protein